ncbi:MAG: chemotaxis protein CheC [Dehalococcoidia bacterium]|jgi:chemotaxis protein CheC|uniref:chemotaxis protein CheC n=1 Tax=Candidatus Amarobacter glycogenicus TaxID=3140699 RepID=UPI001E0B167B|nr:chemotaxis protein CheC [Dehalococcoidia bacterium]HQV92324.1 chemotaxis protein CheC [Phycicoccus sp.]MBK6561037.1 chemotaxis protein CheC [Dehalococcoidia bacterium]MBK7125389.1 chemotaxis protein CheC [Dehalococcoidia bacterium]MBK7328847.1 chemotaxis protein CheC [Dehalococcoidia bacterium]
MHEQLISTLSTVAKDGAFRAGRGLSGLMGQEIAIHVPNVRIGTKADACDAVGGEETIVLGAYLSISGDITGHVMLLFPVPRALECVDLMCGQPPGTTQEPDELSDSAIGELGNIVGSAFINALADHLNLILHPSPPSVINDMAIALVESVYAEVLSQGSDVVMMDAIFEDHSGKTAGLLLVAPDPVSLERLQRVAA